MRTQSIQPQWKFRTAAKYPRSVLDVARQPIYPRKENAPDDFLKAVFDASASNVAVIDEAGAVLYASRGWRTFERDVQSGLKGQNIFQRRFENCKAFTEPGTCNEADLSLADDIENVLTGNQKEFHRRYYYDELTKRRPFTVHAACLRLPGLTFRALITKEDPPPVQMSEEEFSKELGGRLIAAQEEERKRIARELHDDLNQRMAVLSMDLEQLGQKFRKQANVFERFQKLQAQALEISTDIHRLAYKLHPSKLDHLGLAPAIKSLCNEISQGGSLKVDFHHSGLPAVISKDVKLCLFRVTQELLRNCAKHSQARSAEVVIRKTAEAICLSVSDDGCGFDTRSGAMEKGLGFISVRERLRALGGEVHVFSQPQVGTRVQVWLPLSCELDSISCGTNRRENPVLSSTTAVEFGVGR
jgi:signal transduction histidine kinase